MKKKLLSGLICAALLVGLFPTALAKTADVTTLEKALVLRELKVFQGDETGALHLETPVTRGEFAKLLVSASPYRGGVAATITTDPFPDVSAQHWASPAVKLAADNGLITGYLDGTFHPSQPVTLTDGVVMTLRLLGYQNSDFSGAWGSGQLALYRSLDLDVGLETVAGTTTLTRGDCLNLFYNLLTAPTKTGTPYIATMGGTLNAQGEVDVEALLKPEQDGPIALVGDWQAALPFQVSAALLYRDGKRATLADLQPWDMLYWGTEHPILWATSDQGTVMGQLSSSLGGPVVASGDWQRQLPWSAATASVTLNGRSATLTELNDRTVVYWSKYSENLYAYQQTVTGLVEGVSPSLANPTAVTLAGRTYPLETTGAQYGFSDLGQWRKGDGVTLLLGRTGGVAAVIAPIQAAHGLVVGTVTALSTQTYTDEKNATYTAKTCILTGTDGQVYSYPWEKDNIKVGDLATATLEDGTLTIAKLITTPLTGTFNADATALKTPSGTLSLSPDVEILDTYGDTAAAKVYPSRLAGVTLGKSSVRYYTTTSDGQLDRLILNNVTGDLHQYGVLTDVSVVSMGTMIQGAYTYDIGGTSHTLPTNGKQYTATVGPFRLWMDGQPSNLTNLTKATAVTLTGERVVSGAGQYTLAETVGYYTYNAKDKEYQPATRSQLTIGDYNLTAFYDNTDQNGGRVRVVVGTPR